MRHPPAALLLALAAACGGGADPAPSREAPPAPDGPALVFEETVRSFGTVSDGRTLHCEFPFENRGTEPLHIEEMQASCGCTAAELQQWDFAPGEGDVVRVDWKPKGFGVQSQTVKLASNDPARPLVTLRVSATVEPLFSLEPRRLDLGHLPVAEPHEVRVLVHSDELQAQLVEVVGERPGLSVRARTGEEVGLTDVHTVLDVVLRDLPKGRFFTTLRLRFAGVHGEGGRPREHEVTLPVTATFFETVRAEPNAFAVGLVPPGGEIRSSLRLERDEGGPFRVVHSEVRGCKVPGLRVESRPVPSARGYALELTLVGDVGDYVGPLTGLVHVETDLPEESPFQLVVMGRVGEPTQKL